MKKFVFQFSKIIGFIALFISQFAYAQTEPAFAPPLPITSNYVKAANIAFANIDRSEISTGLLYDYGFKFIHAPYYNGVCNDTNQVDVLKWRRIYATMLACKVNYSFRQMDLGVINDRIDNNTANYGYTPFLMQHIQYETYNPRALSLGLVSINARNQVINNIRYPYQIDHVFATAPAVDYSESGTAQFYFSPDFFVRNNYKEIEKIEVNFDAPQADGNPTDIGKPYYFNYRLTQGYTDITNTNYCNISYTEIGKRIIRVHLRYTDGTEYYSHSNFQVAQKGVTEFITVKNADKKGSNHQSLVYSDPNSFVTVGISPTNEHSGGTLQIAQCTQTRNTVGAFLRKPLIIVEGLDPEVAGSTKDFTLTQLIVGNFRDDKGFRIGNNFETFENHLDLTANYDLVFLNFNNGTDDIRRNARLFQEAVRLVNNMKRNMNGVREQNVVLGISMGGLVARYGLAQIVAENTQNAETRLLLTYDSPHRGANVPLGFQAAFNDMYKANVAGIPLRWVVPALGKGKTLLESMAVRQMLIVRDDNLGTDFLRTEYRQMVNRGLGNCRMIAVSKGSECGIPQLQTNNAGRGGPDFLLAGDVLLEGHGRFLLDRVAFTVAQLGITAGLNFVPIVGPFLATTFFAITTVVNVLFADIDRKLDITVRALPDRRVAQIYHSKLEASNTFLGIKLFTVTEFEHNRYSQTTHLAYDGAGGSSHYLGTIQGTTDNYLIHGYPFLELDITIRNSLYFGFMPTASALDVEITAQSLLSPFHSNLSLLSPSPFQEFITQNNTTETYCARVENEVCVENLVLNVANTSHDNGSWFDARSANWFFNILENLPQTINVCNTACPLLLDMTVPDAICKTPQQATLSVTNIPNAVYTWTWNNNDVYAISGLGTSALTVSSRGNYSGLVNFTVSINIGCVSSNLTRQIWVGEPNPLSLAGGVEVCNYVITATSAGATNFIWDVVDSNNNTMGFSILPNRNGIAIHASDWISQNLSSITVTCKASNICNTANPHIRTRLFNRPSFPLCPLRVIQPTFTAFPNPTNSILNLKFDNLDTNITSICLMNNLGVKVLCEENTQLSTEKQSSLNLSNLSEGIYILQVVYENGFAESKKIVVQKGIIAN
jgi:hypothetical protein